MGLLFVLIHQSPLAHATLQIQGAAGDLLSISWEKGGDPAPFTLTGTIDVIEHQYATPGVYRIDISGNRAEAITQLRAEGISLSIAQAANTLTALQALIFDNNNIINFIVSPTLRVLTNVSFFQNNLNETTVNHILQTINDFNTSQTGAFIKLEGGTNAAPTGGGIAAKNQLVSRGWTVTTN